MEPSDKANGLTATKPQYCKNSCICEKYSQKRNTKVKYKKLELFRYLFTK